MKRVVALSNDRGTEDDEAIVCIVICETKAWTTREILFGPLAIETSSVRMILTSVGKRQRTQRWDTEGFSECNLVQFQLTFTTHDQAKNFLSPLVVCGDDKKWKFPLKVIKSLFAFRFAAILRKKTFYDLKRFRESMRLDHTSDPIYWDPEDASVERCWNKLPFHPKKLRRDFRTQRGKRKILLRVKADRVVWGLLSLSRDNKSEARNT